MFEHMDSSVLQLGFERVKSLTVAEQASKILRKKIVSGELSAGQHLKEDDFVQLLGISKISVREAFSILIQEGLLEKVNNKFTRVVVFNRADVREMYELRSAIEMLCVERCIQEATIPVDALEKQVKDINELINENGVTECFEEFVDKDMDFHEMIVMAAGNQRAQQIWLSLKNQLKILFFSQLKRYPNSVQNEESLTHAYILKVMRMGDTELAKQLIRKHIYGSYVTRMSDPMLLDAETDI